MPEKQQSRNVSASIIIVSYNSSNDLAECIPSILAQTYKDFELIIVDNSPFSESFEHIKNGYPEIKYIKNDSNVGYPTGNNIGVKYAKGKYIVIVNPDTIADDNWLMQLIKPLEDNREIAITTSKILLNSARDRINTFSNYSHFTGLGFCKGLGEPICSYPEPEEVCAISGCSFAMRRSVFEELGGFDVDFFLYLEDADLSWRARLAGHKIMAIPTSIIYHKFKLSLAPWKEFYLERNRYQMLLKGYSLKMLVISFPALFVTEVVTWGHAVLKGVPYMQNKLKAYWWIFTNISPVIEKRHMVQQSRKISDKEFIGLLEWRIPFEQLINNKIACFLADKIFNTFYWLYFSIIKLII